MKTIEQFKEEYPINDEKITKVDIIEQIYDAIDAAVEFAESWIDINEELPELLENQYDILTKRNETVGILSIHYTCDILLLKTHFTYWRPINRP